MCVMQGCNLDLDAMTSRPFRVVLSGLVFHFSWDQSYLQNFSITSRWDSGTRNYCSDTINVRQEWKNLLNSTRNKKFKKSGSTIELIFEYPAIMALDSRQVNFSPRLSRRVHWSISWHRRLSLGLDSFCSSLAQCERYL